MICMPDMKTNDRELHESKPLVREDKPIGFEETEANAQQDRPKILPNQRYHYDCDGVLTEYADNGSGKWYECHICRAQLYYRGYSKPNTAIGDPKDKRVIYGKQGKKTSKKTRFARVRKDHI